MINYCIKCHRDISHIPESSKDPHGYLCPVCWNFLIDFDMSLQTFIDMVSIEEIDKWLIKKLYE